MTIVRLRQTIAEETMFPPRAPFFVKAWGTSRFPTPLHARRAEIRP